jgi:transposase
MTPRDESVPDDHTGNEPNHVRRARVLALYRSGLSIRAVAAEVGVTFQAVHGMLQRMGEPRRKAGGNMGSHSRHRK